MSDNISSFIGILLIIFLGLIILFAFCALVIGIIINLPQNNYIEMDYENTLKDIRIMADSDDSLIIDNLSKIIISTNNWEDKKFNEYRNRRVCFNANRLELEDGIYIFITNERNNTHRLLLADKKNHTYFNIGEYIKKYAPNYYYELLSKIDEINYEVAKQEHKFEPLRFFEAINATRRK